MGTITSPWFKTLVLLTIYSLGRLDCRASLEGMGLVEPFIHQAELYLYVLGASVGSYAVQTSHLAFFYLTVWVLFTFLAR